MAVFLLKVYHGTSYAPPPAQGVFSDVAITLPLAPWIEELARLSVTAGCGGSAYCPSNSVTRGQMAVFMSKTFHRPEAIRFLEQATWGPDRRRRRRGARAGLSALARGAVLALPASSYPGSLYPLWPDDIAGLLRRHLLPRQLHGATGCRTRFFTNALYQPDQLRQRVAWALHKIVVVSEDTMPYPFQIAPYLRVARPERVRQLPRHPLPGHAQPGDGRVPRTWTRPPSTTRTRTTRARSCSSSRSERSSSTRTARRRTTSTGPCPPTTSPSSTSSSASTPAGTSTRCPARAPNGADDVRRLGRPDVVRPRPARHRREDALRRVPGGPVVLPADQTGAQDLNAGDRRDLQPPERRPVPRARAHPQPRDVEPVSPATSSAWPAPSTTTAAACAAASGRWSRRSCSTRRRGASRPIRSTAT